MMARNNDVMANGENRRSVQGQRRESLAEVYDGDAGDWYIPPEGDKIFLNVPQGERSHRTCLFPFEEPNDNGASWKWDGDRDAPTLSPSLHWVGVWHGWMRDGKLQSV